MQPLPATERLNRQHRSASSLPRRLPRRYGRKVASRPCTVRRVGDNVFVERVWRSVKYEQVYLKTYDSVSPARADIIAVTLTVTTRAGGIQISGMSRPKRLT